MFVCKTDRHTATINARVSSYRVGGPTSTGPNRECTMRFVILAILGALAQGCTTSSGSSGTEDGCISNSNCGGDISSQATDAGSGDATSSPNGDVAFNDTIGIDAMTVELPSAVTNPLDDSWTGLWNSPKNLGDMEKKPGIIDAEGIKFPDPGFPVSVKDIRNGTVDYVKREVYVCPECFLGMQCGTLTWVSPL